MVVMLPKMQATFTRMHLYRPFCQPSEKTSLKQLVMRRRTEREGERDWDCIGKVERRSDTRWQRVSIFSSPARPKNEEKRRFWSLRKKMNADGDGRDSHTNV